MKKAFKKTRYQLNQQRYVSEGDIVLAASRLDSRKTVEMGLIVPDLLAYYHCMNFLTLHVKYTKVTTDLDDQSSLMCLYKGVCDCKRFIEQSKHKFDSYMVIT